jgi:hypothetical protein
MTPQTTYHEVEPTDRSVVAFLCAQLGRLDVYNLPKKAWVARRDEDIIAVLTFRPSPVPSIDLFVADPLARPFMRIMKLWRVARQWLDAHNVPLVCASVKNCDVHWQELLQRIGFEPVGEEFNADGEAVETIFGRKLAA